MVILLHKFPVFTGIDIFLYITDEDAWEKITAGDCFLEIYTGFIYEGPWIVRCILEGLVQKLEENRLENIAEAVESS
ncbi:hypothetical protein [Laspinema palackyanum]|uniref:hypothetical protein n=1 Tax=Laspinema palackyanum TaxID=3231601 RepID=UPI00349F0E73